MDIPAYEVETIWDEDNEVDYAAMSEAWLAAHKEYTALGEQTEIVSANITEFTAYTSGETGGNRGCVTTFSIKDLGSTQWGAMVVADRFNCEGLYVILEGDHELQTVIDGLRWIADSLERQAKERKNAQ